MQSGILIPCCLHLTHPPDPFRRKSSEAFSPNAGHFWQDPLHPACNLGATSKHCSLVELYDSIHCWIKCSHLNEALSILWAAVISYSWVFFFTFFLCLWKKDELVSLVFIHVYLWVCGEPSFILSYSNHNNVSICILEWNIPGEYGSEMEGARIRVSEMEGVRIMQYSPKWKGP